MSRRQSCYYINYRASRESKKKTTFSRRQIKDHRWKNNFCFETPINNKMTDNLLINRTRSPREKKNSRGQPHPPRKLPPSGSPPPTLWISVAVRGGYGFFSGTTHWITFLTQANALRRSGKDKLNALNKLD